jgi:CrcB protein
MVTYFWIGLGSALGGMGRYWCSGLVARSVGEVFPWGTIAVNVVGSLVIGFLATWLAVDGRLLVAPDARAFLMYGICGGYTTFSSFSLETLNLARDGEWVWAAANIFLSVALCLLAVWLGHIGASALNR